MTSLQNIQALISQNHLDSALSQLDALIAADGDSAEALYMRGRVHWRLGDKRRAINDYTAAAALDPACGAAEALEQAYAILDFYNRDLYNP